MANIHVLEFVDTNKVRVVAHVAIPETTNNAGLTWRQLALLTDRGGTTILRDGDGTLGTISAAEKTQILAGAIIEVQATLEIETVAKLGRTAYYGVAFEGIQAAYVKEFCQTYKHWGIIG